MTKQTSIEIYEHSLFFIKYTENKINYGQMFNFSVKYVIYVVCII